MVYRLAELAERVGGRVEGDPERLVEAVRPLESAGPRDLSFLKDPRYRGQASASAAGALLVGPSLADAVPGRDLLVADDPSWALARLLALLHPEEPRPPGIHPTAILEPGATVDPTAHVGPYAVIGPASRIAAGAAVLAFVAVGRGCAVGEGAVLHPHAVLYDGTEVGAGSIVHAGVVLGADGFGYATHQGAHHKVPQVGRVVLEEDVEVGANSTIDRATLGETRIGAGSKIDNLVQVGHNVVTGRHCILCGQAGDRGERPAGRVTSCWRGRAASPGTSSSGTAPRWRPSRRRSPRWSRGRRSPASPRSRCGNGGARPSCCRAWRRSSGACGPSRRRWERRRWRETEP